MELKKEDLRYGNKIMFLGEIQTFEFIDQFREDGVFWIQTKEQKIAHKNFQFKPIPLSEDILLKCPDYKKAEFANYFTFSKGAPYSKGQMFITVDFRDNTIQVSVGEGGDKCGYVFLPWKESLHEFQNFHFSLTNTEINLNL